jgi:hypothetical protein
LLSAAVYGFFPNQPENDFITASNKKNKTAYLKNECRCNKPVYIECIFIWR